MISFSIINNLYNYRIFNKIMMFTLTILSMEMFHDDWFLDHPFDSKFFFV
jgi:hypothetical protein